jgi:prevent-host-death family protein
MVIMAAGEFKAKCLKLMEDVRDAREEIIITKHGKPVAKLVPVEEKKTKSVFGYLKGSVKVSGDITKPLLENWSALKR